MGESTEEVVAKDKKKGDAIGKEVVVLKINLHCRGCASKILKCVKGFEGVAGTKVEMEANKLTVEGKVDASKLREKLQAKTKKKVEIVSPQQKKEKENNIKNNNGNNESETNKISEKKSGEKKPKELPVTTVVIKLGGLDCQGCVTKINKIIGKVTGVQNFTIDKGKEVLTVQGTVDAKALVEKLREKMRRSVEIVPQKKEKDNGGNEKEGGAGGGKKKGGNGGKAEENSGGKVEGNRIEYYGPTQSQPGYGNGVYGGFSYGFMYCEPVHAPQMFSDENPNACSVM